MTTAAITGHRPNKIPNVQFVEAQLACAFLDHKVDRVVQGMAAGVDLLSARTAWAMHIPYVCARPWAGHTPAKGDEDLYNNTINNADRVVVVNPADSYPGPWVYQKRNEWMVNAGDIVIAVWNGTTGGTYNTVTYALKKKKPVWRIDPLTYMVGWLDA